jgi:hypothetical protein
MKASMQYSVRNRRRLRSTGEQAVPRTVTARGTGVADVAVSGTPAPVLAEGSGVVRTHQALQTIDTPVKEITPARVIKNNWQR